MTVMKGVQKSIKNIKQFLSALVIYARETKVKFLSFLDAPARAT